jgi:ABC-type transporter Mla subunit MlaD
MAKEHNALKVGAVTIVVLTAFFVILIWISRGVSGDMQAVMIRFKATPAMPTLSPGSQVLVAGAKVGSVVNADLVEDEMPTPPAPKDAAVTSPARPEAGTGKTFILLVKAEVRADLVLHRDCKVFAEGPPLGGDGLLKIDLGTSPELFTRAQLEEPGIIGSEPAGFSAILASLQSEFDGANPKSLLGQIKTQLDPEGGPTLMAKLLQSLSDINQMTASLNRQLNPEDKAALLAKINQVADNINETTGTLRREFDAGEPTRLLTKIHVAIDTINEGLTTVTGLLKSSEPRLARTIENVETTSVNIASETNPANADSLIAHLKAAGEKLNTSLADLNEVTNTTRQVVVLNRENINRLLANFKEASDYIKTGVKYVLRHPWRLLNEPPAAEIQQEAILDATRNFTEAATAIDDASAQLAALADLHKGNIPANDPDLARILADLKSTQDQYQRAEAALWKHLNAVN